MKVNGDYEANGYAHVEGLIPREIGWAFLERIRADFQKSGVPLLSLAKPLPITRKRAVDVYGYHYTAMIPFLWGLTPVVRELTGRDLLPAYNYFRLYAGGDVCRVHSDREACEHSLSLTLAYSHDRPWSFEIGADPINEPQPIADDFGGATYSSISMQAGDAVLYRGVRHRHGRIQPNPNEWSAHLFFHWVDRQGRYRSHAFDGRAPRSFDAFAST